ncbi:hypothetical protein DPMN_170529 [Dreissena polymorpha]|uniref:Uncharacterized protein n=1 Tax=Dreissena polymorpha TaxID=45954 RepID=A0A9D4IDA1_DREPO|nr:hypothetical protein DPMN_170529 [Dreissena polymorpha]
MAHQQATIYMLTTQWAMLVTLLLCGSTLPCQQTAPTRTTRSPITCSAQASVDLRHLFKHEARA